MENVATVSTTEFLRALKKEGLFSGTRTTLFSIAEQAGIYARGDRQFKWTQSQQEIVRRCLVLWNQQDGRLQAVKAVLRTDLAAIAELQDLVREHSELSAA